MLKALSGAMLSSYSPQNLLEGTLWISGKIRKEFLFPYIHPSLFKDKNEQVCKYFV